MFHKELCKTVGAFALKGTTYIDIDKKLIELKAKNAGKVRGWGKLLIAVMLIYRHWIIAAL